MLLYFYINFFNEIEFIALSVGMVYLIIAFNMNKCELYYRLHILQSYRGKTILIECKYGVVFWWIEFWKRFSQEGILISHFKVTGKNELMKAFIEFLSSLTTRLDKTDFAIYFVVRVGICYLNECYLRHAQWRNQKPKKFEFTFTLAFKSRWQHDVVIL